MTTLNVRNIDPEVKARLKRLKDARGLTYAECIERLVALHEAALRDEFGNCQKLLASVKLAPVTV